MTDVLTTVRKEIGNIPKRGRNPHFGNTYATYEDIRAAVDPVLEKHGIKVIQALTSVEGKPALYTSVEGDDGLSFGGMVPLPGDTAQAIGASITYMRRYALVTILGLITEDDDDGNSAQPARVSMGAVESAIANGIEKSFPGTTVESAPSGDGPSEKQWSYLASLTKQTVEVCKAQYGALTKKQMSQTIDSLKPSAKPQYPAGQEEF